MTNKSAPQEYLFHPKTILAYTKRCESVVKRNRPLSVEQTQKYRLPESSTHIQELSKPLDRHALVPLPTTGDAPRPGFPVRRHHRRENSTMARLNDFRFCAVPQPNTTCDREGGDSPLTRRPLSAPSRHSFAVPMVSPLEAQCRREAIRREEQIAMRWPSPDAEALTKSRHVRFHHSKISTRLFRAVFGFRVPQELERQEREDQESGLSVRNGSDDDADLFSPPPDEQSEHRRGRSGKTQRLRDAHKSIFVLSGAAQDDDGCEEGQPGASKGLTGQTDASPYDDPSYRDKTTYIGAREYAAVRSLFCEIDGDGSGTVELSELLGFTKRFPRRLPVDVLHRLKVEADGKVYFDEFLMAFFPNLSGSFVEQLMEQHEPKCQDISDLPPEVSRQLSTLYRTAVQSHNKLTLAQWMFDFGDIPLSSSPLGGSGLMNALQLYSFLNGLSSCSIQQFLAILAQKHIQLKPHYPAELRAWYARHGKGGETLVVPSGDASARSFSSHYGGSASGLRPSIASRSDTDETVSEISGVARLGTRFPMRSTADGVVVSAESRVLNPQQGSVFSPVVVDRMLLTLPYRTAAAGAEPASGANEVYLAACPIRFKDFATVFADYYVMNYRGEDVAVFDPPLREKLNALRWERLFPFTGKVKDYFH